MIDRAVEQILGEAGWSQGQKLTDEEALEMTKRVEDILRRKCREETFLEPAREVGLDLRRGTRGSFDILVWTLGPLHGQKSTEQLEALVASLEVRRAEEAKRNAPVLGM